jgi:hypothetical protein
MAATVAPRPSVERTPPSHVGFGAAPKQTLVVVQFARLDNCV